MFSFLKSRKRLMTNRQFDYMPRYYNPEKEEQQSRHQRVRDNSPEARAERISAGMRRSRSTARSKNRHQSMIRLAVVLGVLVVATIYIIQYVLPRVHDWLG